MRRANRTRLTCFALCLVTLLPLSCHAQQVAEYFAQYKASANGIAATAERRLTRLGDNSFRLTNQLQAVFAGQVIARLEQTSELEITGSHVRPLAYSYQLSGIASAVQAIAYNWDAAIALSSEGENSWQLALDAEVQDPLSIQFALRQAFNEDLNRNQLLQFKVIDKDEIEIHRYRIVADEILQTPLGRLNSVRLERVREGSGSRTTTIWLARDWHYLLIKIEQVNGSGLQIELELESATVNGQPVLALP